MLDLSELAEKDPEQELEAHYRRRFTQRYKHNPVITDEDKPIFAWLAKEFGKGKAIQVIDTYLRSNDKFLVEKGHAPRFIKSGINALIAGSGIKSEPVKRTTLNMAVTVSCDGCFQVFTWTGTPAELEKRRLCPDCRPKK